jgi:hypothetical protein
MIYNKPIFNVNPNDFINPNFDLWQAATSVTTNSAYAADMWQNFRIGSTYTTSQQVNTGLNLGFNCQYFHRTAVTSVAGSTNNMYVGTYFEDVRNFAGTTRTYSFWAKADAAKNIALEWRQTFGTTGGPSTFVTAQVDTIPLTTSWTKYTRTVTFPSIAGKTIGTDENSSYTQLRIWFDAGSTYNANTNSLGQQSGTYDIGQFMMCEGFQVVPYVQHGGSAAANLSACQRYYEKSWDLTTAVGANVAEGCITGVAFSTTGILANQGYKVTKRTTPTVLIYGRDGTINKVSTIGGGLVTGSVNSSSSESINKIGNIGYDTASFTAQTTYRFHFVADARF